MSLSSLSIEGFGMGRLWRCAKSRLGDAVDVPYTCYCFNSVHALALVRFAAPVYMV